MSQQRNTRQRQMVLDAVQSHRDHPTADEIYLYVRQQDDKISRGTVYRNLKQLIENGEIQPVKLPDAERFDWRKDMHYHLRCTQCNQIFDSPIPYNTTLDEQIAKDTNYQMVHHRIIFEGVCPNCQNKQKDTNSQK